MTQDARRKTLFALETVFSLFFLLLCYFAVHLPLSILESLINHGRLAGPTLPKLTQWIQWILPENATAGILGSLAIAAGFASVASVSQEALSSRLFRWFLIPLGMAVLAAILPLAESYVHMCGGTHDNGWLDEMVFLALCMTLGYLGLRHARRNQPTSAPGEARKSHA